jgi:energy-coupling factor transport system ATP-binding protein
MLDPIGRADILGIMERLNREEGITVINITHYMEEAARADRVVVINDGRLVLDGTAKSVFSNVDYLHSIGLEAPQGKELLHELIKDGYDLSEDALSEDECVEALLNLIDSRKERNEDA